MKTLPPNSNPRTPARRPFRVFFLLLYLTLLSAFYVSTTMARYLTHTGGDSVARVAKWQIVLNGDHLQATGADDAVSFPLFETVHTVGGGLQTDLAPGTIAPGTEGAFTLLVENRSDVAATLTSLALSADNPYGIPLRFSANGLDWTDDITTLSLSAVPLGIGQQVSMTLYWQWSYHTDAYGDYFDTLLGQAAAEAGAIIGYRVNQGFGEHHRGELLSPPDYALLDEAAQAYCSAVLSEAPAITVTASLSLEQVD
ncbi:MAG: hypothetical protein WDA00_03675 [Eubacteriales bacterium]